MQNARNVWHKRNLNACLITLRPLLTASSCFFFWTRSSSIRLTFARSKFSWSGLNTSWNTCHRDPFWGSETSITRRFLNNVKAETKCVRLPQDAQKERGKERTYRMSMLYLQDDLILASSPLTFVSV